MEPPVVAKFNMPPALTVTALDPVTVVVLVLLKLFNVTVTLAGTLKPLMLDCRLSGNSTTLPPTASPPDTCRLPRRKPLS